MIAVLAQVDAARKGAGGNMIEFLLGFSIGAAVMWAYFHLAGLIRTREEFYAAKKSSKHWDMYE